MTGGFAHKLSPLDRPQARRLRGRHGDTMSSIKSFPGTDEEAEMLLHAVDSHCTHQAGPDGQLTGACTAHSLIAGDRWRTGIAYIFGLLKQRRRAQWLLMNEFDSLPPTTPKEDDEQP